MLYRLLLSVLLVVSLSCKQNSEEKTETIPEEVKTTTYYQEKFRPQFHFSPPEKWMNDPNGLVYNDGVYHLFYQYYPEDIVWGPMHWGHAVSKDMVYWEHKPIALYPDELGYIFSGSAVMDDKNTSGFGTPAESPMVAIYTYHLMEGEKAGRNDFQTQGIAYSLDNGDSWTTYEGNPVIGNKDIRDFRDPKVFWYEESSKWVMALVAGDHVKFYGSHNLKDWELLSEFGRDVGAHGGVWECPDLFKLKVEGSEEEKWVLYVSINPGAPNGGSGTQYFVGEFDGTTFTSEQEHQWIDLGRDNYAGVTYNNTPDGKRTFIGWMSNWDYAQVTPTEVWRSAMTVPRDVTLHKEGEQYFVKSYPVEAFNSLASEISSETSITLDEAFIVRRENLNSTEIRFDVNLSKRIDLVLSNDNDESLSFTMDPESKALKVDRRGSGLTDFEDRFAGDIQTQSYIPATKNAEVRVICDASSIEIFVDKGRYIFTNQVFPQSPYTNLLILSDDEATLSNFQLNQLTSIWNSNE